MNIKTLAITTTFVACLGCSKKMAGSEQGGYSHVGGTPSTDEVVDALKSAGLPIGGFSVVDPLAFHAGYCAQGRVGSIETLICEYRDDVSLDRAKKALQKQWSQENVHTGVAVRAKRTLLAVADRAKTDPNGKTI